MHWLYKVQRTKGKNNGQEGSKWGGYTLKQAFRTNLVSVCKMTLKEILFM